MARAGGYGVVVHRTPGGIDAIDQYSRRLVEALRTGGADVRYVADGLGSVATAAPTPDWVLLQYNPFRYGRAGFAPGLLRELVRVRRRSRARLGLMVHEAWLDMVDPRSTAIGLWHRAQLRALVPLADHVMTSTEALARELGGAAVPVGIPATILPVAATREEARGRLGLPAGLTITLFGRANPSRLLGYAEAAIAALADAVGSAGVTVLNLGADAPELRAPSGVEVRTPGRLPAEELSLGLRATDLLLLPLDDGVSTRRTTLMAAFAHGLPVLGLAGRNTDAVLRGARDALALTPVGDVDAYVRSAVALAGDEPRRRSLGEAARRLYEERYDWPVHARAVSAEIAGAPARGRVPGRGRARGRGRGRGRVIFVAHDVGGPGGMEHQSERLVSGLLDAGRSVTVVARTCALPPRPGLRFVRVRGPARPAAIAYPAFAAVASWRVGRRGDAILHTTGAIVVNRADVSTVHYCHHAAVAEIDGSRASRPGPLYAVNAAVAKVLSLAGETWCYRPTRTRLLCAVSGGVASELEHGFPAMNAGIRTIPNGVDAARFAPDAAARAEVRAELGLAPDTRLALFAGGDWERKGLGFAIDALANAPSWHLAVAGAGNPEPHLERAREAGTTARIHFLGRVREMPRLYAAGDAFVFPTTYEAFPLVALEAAASGLPLLVTRVNGVVELVQDGIGGWFIQRDAADIARRLTALADDPERARRMGAAARQAASAYTWGAMVDGYQSVYAELVNGHRLG